MTTHPHHVDLGGRGPALHLAPANGFPPESYQPLADQLAQQFHVIGYRPRPLWPGSRPDSVDSWHDLADDLLAALTACPTPLVGAGHSLGGILTLYAALRRPELFRGVALIDPVIMPRHLLPLLWLMHRFGQGRRFPLARAAARRRDSFASPDEARARYTGRGVFAGFAPEALDRYIESGLRPAGAGVTLAWPREWESRIFSLVPLDTWDAVARLRLPLLIIRGRRSDLMVGSSWRELRRRLPRATLVDLEGGHMVPMERPALVARAIRDWAAGLAPG